MKQYVLIVEDDPAQRRVLEETTTRLGFETIVADGARAAIETLDGPNAGKIGVVLLNSNAPECDGADVLLHMEKKASTVPVILQTAQGSVGTLRAGADDFLVKPVDPVRLRVSLQNLLKVNALAAEVKRLRKAAEGALTFDDLVAASPAMANVAQLGRRAARSDIPILIEGESGVGKEVVARAVQGESDRRGRPLVAVNCGAIPENLAESVLFGHEKGSFEGATAGCVGKFREADGGTLFLDDVCELPPGAQVKLLRAIQEGEIDPIGAKRPVRVDVRLISATDRDMIDMVRKGVFREDLYYRLNVFPIAVPPLSRRPEDMAGLAERFVTRFAAEEGRRIRGIRPDAMTMLEKYEWPGNVRQLENAIFRAVVLCDGDFLTVSDFPQIAALVDGFEAETPAAPAATATAGTTEGVVSAMIGGETPRIRPAAGMVSDGVGYGIPAVTEGGHIRRLADVESDMIRLALGRYRGQMSEVARKLGIGRSTLYRKMRELDLENLEVDSRALNG